MQVWPLISDPTLRRDQELLQLVCHDIHTRAAGLPASCGIAARRLGRDQGPAAYERQQRHADQGSGALGCGEVQVGHCKAQQRRHVQGAVKRGAALGRCARSGSARQRRCRQRRGGALRRRNGVGHRWDAANSAARGALQAVRGRRPGAAAARQRGAAATARRDLD